MNDQEKIHQSMVFANKIVDDITPNQALELTLGMIQSLNATYVTQVKKNEGIQQSVDLLARIGEKAAQIEEDMKTEFDNPMHQLMVYGFLYCSILLWSMKEEPVAQ